MTRAQGQKTSSQGSTPSGVPGSGQGRTMTYPEGALGHVDASPGNDDSVLNGLGGHIGAAEGAIAIGDDLDVNGAAICVLWASPSKVERSQASSEHRRPLLAAGGPPCPLLTHSQAPSPAQSSTPHALEARVHAGDRLLAIRVAWSPSLHL